MSFTLPYRVSELHLGINAVVQVFQSLYIVQTQCLMAILVKLFSDFQTQLPIAAQTLTFQELWPLFQFQLGLFLNFLTRIILVTRQICYSAEDSSE